MDILRAIIQGEQGDIRLLGSDRIRYAVYSGKLPGCKRKYNVVYILNTDPDCSAIAKLEIKGKTTDEISIRTNELCLAFQYGEIVIIAENKCIDIKSWKDTGKEHVIEFYCVSKQRLQLYNFGKNNITVSVNQKPYICVSGKKKNVFLDRHVDPERKQFFSRRFLAEPEVENVGTKLPY